jgi:hypothetical protein
MNLNFSCLVFSLLFLLIKSKEFEIKLCVQEEEGRERERELGDNNIRELLNMKFVCILCYEFLHHPLEILGISKGNNCVKRHNL